MAIFVLNKDTRLFTTLYPNSDKESVILLHGGPGVPEDLGAVAAFLSQEFQVIYFHQRGTLKSPCLSGNYSIEAYLSDIDRLASHFHLRRFHLLGHSWGGLYAQLYADQRPEKLLSLFLCSPASGTGRQWAEMALEIRRFNKKRSSLGEWIKMNGNALLGLLGNRKAYQKFYSQFAINCNKGYLPESAAPLLVDHLQAQPINQTNKAVLQYRPLRPLPAPGIKTTVTYGDDDIYGDSPGYVQQRYPTARFITIARSSHNPWLHNPKAFFEVLAAHFDSRMPA